VLVADVHAFPDHISCDSRSLSEITLPVYDDQGHIVAVFDVDSDQKNAFTQVDQGALSEIMALIFSTE
jgi:GAF domain-containing protein